MRTYTRKSIHERFSDYCLVGDSQACWPWQGMTSSNGYGMLRKGGKGEGLLMAHRVSYEHFVGPIPEGLVIDHLCRVRNCVNPHHLEPVTQTENKLRGVGACAVHARKTHCPKGHGYAEHGYREGKGRRCGLCRSEPVWKEASGLCKANLHDLNVGGARTANGKCRACVNAYKARWRAAGGKS